MAKRSIYPLEYVEPLMRSAYSATESNTSAANLQHTSFHLPKISSSHPAILFASILLGTDDAVLPSFSELLKSYERHVVICAAMGGVSQDDVQMAGCLPVPIQTHPKDKLCIEAKQIILGHKKSIYCMSIHTHMHTHTYTHAHMHEC